MSNSPGQVTRPMGKQPQDKFRRLAIVPPANEKRRQQPQPRWPAAFDRTTQQKFRPVRMAIMPTLSRGLWIVVLAWLWNFLRNYFAGGKKQKQDGAKVLSFRHKSGFDFVTKKASGSVLWNSEREVAPQEGGRG
jgi:hypothetical protein